MQFMLEDLLRIRKQELDLGISKLFIVESREYTAIEVAGVQERMRPRCELDILLLLALEGCPDAHCLLYMLKVKLLRGNKLGSHSY